MYDDGIVSVTRSRTKQDGHGHRNYGRGKRSLSRGHGETIRFMTATERDVVAAAKNINQ